MPIILSTWTYSAAASACWWVSIGSTSDWFTGTSWASVSFWACNAGVPWVNVVLASSTSGKTSSVTFITIEEVRQIQQNIDITLRQTLIRSLSLCQLDNLDSRLSRRLEYGLPLYSTCLLGKWCTRLIQVLRKCLLDRFRVLYPSCCTGGLLDKGCNNWNERVIGEILSFTYVEFSLVVK